MIKDGEKWFAPGVRWADVDIDSPDFSQLLVDRFEGFYFGPADFLLDRNHDFAAGVLLLSALDAMARLLTGIEGVGQRFRTAAEEIGIDRSRVQDFYDMYRNGLLHEGRIKSGACFDQEAKGLLEEINGESVVNPRVLLKAVRAFSNELVDNEPRFRAYALPLLVSDIQQG